MSDDPANSVKALKEDNNKHNKHNKHTHTKTHPLV